MGNGDAKEFFAFCELKTPPLGAEARLEAGELLRSLQEGEVIPRNKFARRRVRMDEATKNAAEEAGFRKTSVSEFLGLSESDKLVVELRRILAAELRKRREDADMTQSDLADRRETTQSRISNLESGEASVSIDALVGALAELGVDREEIGRLIAA